MLLAWILWINSEIGIVTGYLLSEVFSGLFYTVWAPESIGFLNPLMSQISFLLASSVLLLLPGESIREPSTALPPEVVRDSSCTRWFPDPHRVSPVDRVRWPIQCIKYGSSLHLVALLEIVTVCIPPMEGERIWETQFTWWVAQGGGPHGHAHTHAHTHTHIYTYALYITLGSKSYYHSDFIDVETVSEWIKPFDFSTQSLFKKFAA